MSLIVVGIIALLVTLMYLYKLHQRQRKQEDAVDMWENSKKAVLFDMDSPQIVVPMDDQAGDHDQYATLGKEKRVSSLSRTCSLSLDRPANNTGSQLQLQITGYGSVVGQEQSASQMAPPKISYFYN